MKRRTLLVGSAALLSGTGLVTGSQGFSRTSAQRETTIQVEDDEGGYLRLQYNAEPDPFDCGDTEFTFIEEIGNQTTATLTSVRVEIKSVPETITVWHDGSTIDTGDIITVLEAPSSDHGDALGVGESVSVDLTVTCDDGVTTSEVVEFDVEIEGDDTSIETERPEAVEVQCECETTAEISGVKFMGGGNAEVLTDPPGASFEIEPTVWYLEGGALVKDDDITIKTSENIRGQIPGAGQRTIVGLSPEGESDWYEHPNYDPDSCQARGDGGEVTELTPVKECSTD